MKKVAILLDAESFALALKRTLNIQGRPTADQTHRNSLRMASADEEVLRIFYYDSQPFEGTSTHPLTGLKIDYKNTPQAHARRRFLSELGQMDLVALRCGHTRPRGWELKESYLNRIQQRVAGAPVPTVTANDYYQRFEQKGVDMRIGIDVASLSLNGYVDRIIVASNDTDLIPAFKIARRHGVQVVITQIGNSTPHRDLIEDSDFKRVLTPVI